MILQIHHCNLSLLTFMLLKRTCALSFGAILQKVSLFQTVNRRAPVSGPAFVARWAELELPALRDTSAGP